MRKTITVSRDALAEGRGANVVAVASTGRIRVVTRAISSKATASGNTARKPIRALARTGNGFPVSLQMESLSHAVLSQASSM
jgi:hypothetical protein